jgi:hypothetical protein
MSAFSRYNRDFYGWTREQAALLRAGRLSEADLENLAEEIESLGRKVHSDFVARLAVVLLYLLRWAHEPALRGRNWELTVTEQRRRLALDLAGNASLAPLLGEAIAEAYLDAVLRAGRETNMLRDMFPWSCPYTPAQILDDAFWPGEPGVPA